MTKLGKNNFIKALISFAIVFFAMAISCFVFMGNPVSNVNAAVPYNSAFTLPSDWDYAKGGNLIQWTTSSGTYASGLNNVINTSYSSSVTTSPDDSEFYRFNMNNFAFHTAAKPAIRSNNVDINGLSMDIKFPLTSNLYTNQHMEFGIGFTKPNTDDFQYAPAGRDVNDASYTARQFNFIFRIYQTDSGNQIRLYITNGNYNNKLMPELSMDNTIVSKVPFTKDKPSPTDTSQYGANYANKYWANSFHGANWNCIVMQTPKYDASGNSLDLFSINIKMCHYNDYNYVCDISMGRDNTLAGFNSGTYRVYIPQYIIRDNYTNAVMKMNVWADNIDGSAPNSSDNLTFDMRVNQGMWLNMTTSSNTMTFTQINNGSAMLRNKIKVDGLSVYFTTQNFVSASAGNDIVGFGFAKNNTDYVPDKSGNFMALLTTKISPNQKGLMFTRRLSADPTANIAFRDSDVTGRLSNNTNFTKHAGTDNQHYWAFPGTTDRNALTYIGATITFNHIPEQRVWKLTLAFVNAGDYGDTTKHNYYKEAFISEAYFANVLDADGKAWFQIFGGYSQSDYVNAKLRIREGTALTLNAKNHSYTKMVAVGQSFTLEDPATENVKNGEAITNGEVFIGWKIDDVLYTSGQKIVNATYESGTTDVNGSWGKTLDAEAVYVDYSLTDGANMRWDHNHHGLRFHSELVDDAGWQYMTANDKKGIQAINVKEVGIIIMPTDLIVEGKLFTIANYPSTATGGVQIYSVSLADINNHFDANGRLDIYTTLNNIRGVNYNRSYSVRNFIKYTVTNNTTNAVSECISYGSYQQSDNSRSIFTVASRALSGGDGINYDFINRYVESVPMLDYQAVTTSSDKKTVLTDQFKLVETTAKKTTHFIKSIKSAVVNKQTVTITFETGANIEVLVNGQFAGIIHNQRRAQITGQTFTPITKQVTDPETGETIDQITGYTAVVTYKIPLGAIPEDLMGFWSGDTIYNEPVILTATTDCNGNIIGVPKAKLLFPATEIISVQNFYNPLSDWYKARVAEYESTKNVALIGDMSGMPVTTIATSKYEYANGFLYADPNTTKGVSTSYTFYMFENTGGTSIKWNPVTESYVKTFKGDVTTYASTFTTWNGVPYVTDRQVRGQDPWPGLNPTTNSAGSNYGKAPSNDNLGRGETSGAYSLPNTSGLQIVQVTLYVTYKHNEQLFKGSTVDWGNPYIGQYKGYLDVSFQGNSGGTLERSYTKLKTGVLGDFTKSDGTTITRDIYAYNNNGQNYNTNNSFNILILGDDNGNDSFVSRDMSVQPLQQEWSANFANSLAQTYGYSRVNAKEYQAIINGYDYTYWGAGQIQVRNYSLPGASSSTFIGSGNDAYNTYITKAGSVADRGLKDWAIDLVIINLGMLDAWSAISNSSGTNTDTTFATMRANLNTLVSDIRSSNEGKNADIIFLTPIINNTYSQKHSYIFEGLGLQIKKVVSENSIKNAYVIDIYVTMRALLAEGKYFNELLANNLYAINDFTSRIIATQLNRALIKNTNPISVGL